MERLSPKHMMSSWGGGGEDALQQEVWLPSSEVCCHPDFSRALWGSGPETRRTWKASFPWEQPVGVGEIRLPWPHGEGCVGLGTGFSGHGLDLSRPFLRSPLNKMPYGQRAFFRAQVVCLPGLGTP